MRKLLVTLDNTLDEWLSGQKNQNETIRQALYLYKGDITTETLAGIRAGYAVLAKATKELDSKVDYIASKVA